MLIPEVVIAVLDFSNSRSSCTGLVAYLIVHVTTQNDLPLLVESYFIGGKLYVNMGIWPLCG
jgi:hypothetical protein